MKKFFGITAVLLVVALLSFDAFAQPGGGGQGGRRGPGGPPPFGGFGGGGFGQILQDDNLKKELGLSEEQAEKLQKVIEESFSRRGQGGDGGERPQPPSREDMEKRQNEMQTKINAVLTPEQQSKAKTIQFQLLGGLDSPFLGARNLEVLKLTEEQKTKIRQVEDQRQEKMRAAFQGFDFRNASQEERDKRRKETEESGKVFMQQIKDVLTPEQKTQAEKLTAEGKDLRKKLGLPEPGQRPQQRGERGNRGGDRGDRGERGGDGYRPGPGSWQPGQGVGDAPETKSDENKPRRTFPRTEKKADDTDVKE